jgi:uncharacterized membrane protein YqiK
MTIVDSIKATSSDKLAPLVMSLLLLVVIVLIIVLLMFFSIPPASKDALLIILGFVGKAFGDSQSYFFGSSSSSKAKDETIKASLTAAEK